MKKTFEVIKTVLTWLIVLLAVCMMVFTIVSVTTFDRNDRALFGYKMYIVRSDSMSATDFKAGDLILVRSVDPATLQEGDIIAYTSQDTASFGETVTHKIRSLTTDADGQPAFITYGTTTDTDDEMPVTYPYVLGKYEKCLSGAGSTVMAVAEKADAEKFYTKLEKGLELLEGLDGCEAFTLLRLDADNTGATVE